MPKPINHGANKEARPEDMPCSHMEGAINKTADGTASWPVRLFAKFHMLHCSYCRKFLASLNKLKAKLVEANSQKPTDEAIERLSHGDWRKAFDEERTT